MAFDGITIAAMVQELHQNLDGGRFNKIAQPEADALMITGKGANGQCRLLLSANASLPLIYFTDKNKPSPLTAPNFCMLLRKHIGQCPHQQYPPARHGTSCGIWTGASQ